ncbi:protein CHLOROPLAST IMPORT APPARATUS 2-like [Bidens hawaiensis]|uniref:protein CHLOROPLAST IMPORT APPARATUS 2-like n=1 Tax=Bidens hawaiensis TaxID=980011 RepID=UPI0040493B64
MASCLSGGVYGIDLENIVKESSSRKTRTPRKRPNQAYNEAAALLSMAFPAIFSITKKNNKQSKLHNQNTCFLNEPPELLLPFPVTERPGKVKPREVEYNGSWNYRPDSSLLGSSEGYEDDFDAESMLDEETEEGIDSIMGNLNFDTDYNTCYGYPIGLRYGGNLGFNFGFGLRNGLEAGSVINMMNLEPESMNPIETGPRLLLKLNYEKVLEAWDKGSRLESPGSDFHAGSAIIDLFSKNGEARKLHVDRRPRSKGRYVRSPNSPTCEET